MQVASTPIDIQELERDLALHPDRDFVSYLLTGLRSGFHTGITSLPRNSIECANLLSARNQSDVVKELIGSELDKGFLIGPYHECPFVTYRINPIGIAESKYSRKKRLIVDLSSPHNNDDNPSLNDLINKDEFSLQYVTVDDAINIIKRFGKGSYLCKTDISDAFKLIPIHPSLWPFHGIKWDGLYYFYTRLVFGSRSSPKIFDCLSQAVCWIAVHRYNIPNILHLLDDFLTVDPPNFHQATSTMEKLMCLFESLGIPIAQHKTVGPSLCLEYLGVTLDCDLMQARLPGEKIFRICEILTEFKDKKCCTKRELLSLLGHLNFASRVIPHGRSFVSYLISLSTKVRELHHHVKLTESCRLDLNMWLLFLSRWNGISFFLNDNVTQAAHMHLFTDATDRAFGGIFGNKWFQGTFPLELYEGKDKISMAFCELFPIVIACVLWGKEWSRKRILFHCDNMATVDIINKGRSKVELIMNLMRKLTFCSMSNNFIVHARHIPGIDNSIADAISRFQMEKFRHLAPHADPFPTLCPPLSSLMLFGKSK
ncbi:uncharacterized protein LOC117333903 [Pecten maximus]|uniref:uncharacterized protein LOC117333903 n=1 Tax=Pecten maximus TaxID=6579 RepID=UPI001457EDDA|nr:uncharacterized protein LOC117333903 [Pecten maximus]